MTALHFDITGDCTGALNALSNTESAIDRVGGMTANPSVGVVGAQAAISQLSGVADAATAASQAVNVSADTRGLVGAQSSVAALRSEIAGMSRDINSVGGLDVGVSGGGDVREMSGAVRSLVGAFEAAAGGMNSFADSGGRASDIGGQLERDMSGTTRAVEAQTRAFQGHASVASDLNAELEAMTANSRELQLVAAGAQNAASAGSALGGASPHAPIVSPSGVPIGAPGTPHGPPLPGGGSGGLPPPFGGWGGGGGGGGGGGHGGHIIGGGGGGRIGGDDEGEGLPRRYLNNLAMLPMVGAAESVLTGAGGFLAVGEAIKNVPLLAAAGKVAMLDFQSGIYQAAQTAAGEGVPALLRLGNTLHGLGTEVGAMGAEHMGTALGGVDELAGKATGALKNLDPAVESSMKGLVGLGAALLDGIGSPSSVNAIKTTGDALADAGNDKGFTSLVNGISTIGGVTATVGADLLGDVGNVTGGIGQKIGALTGQDETPAVQGGLTAGLMTKSPLVGGLTALGLMQAQAEETAGRGDLVTPGIVGGAAGGIGGHKLGGVKGGVAGYVLGDLAAVGGAQLDKADGGGSSFWGDVAQYAAMGGALGAYGGPWGAAGGALLGGAAGGFISMMGDSGGGGKAPSAASPEGIDKKAAEAQKAYAADPTNLGLYQEAAFAKAVADARRQSKNNDDPMAAFMASGPGGGGGLGAPLVGAQGGGSWTVSGGGWNYGGGTGGGAAFDTGGVPVPLPGPSASAPAAPADGGGGGASWPGGLNLPKGGMGLGPVSASTAAALGLGTSPSVGPSGGATGVGPGVGTVTGSSALGGGAPPPAGGWSTDNRVTLANPAGGNSQILSSLTDLRATSSNMFGAMGGLAGGGVPAADLRRDWAATRGMEGANQQQYGDASRYLATDIQQASHALWTQGQAPGALEITPAMDAYTNRLADQNNLAREPAPSPDTHWPGGLGLPAAGPVQAQPPSVGWPGGLASGSSTGLFSGPAAPSAPQRAPSGTPGNYGILQPQIGTTADLGRTYRGPLGPGSTGPGSETQVQRLSQALTTQDGRAAQTAQSNNALTQSLQQVSRGGDQAQQGAHGMQSLQSSMQGISSGAGQAAQSVGGLGDSLKGANAAVGGGGGGGGLAAAIGGAADTGLAGFAASVGTGASAAAKTAGEATASAMAGGMAAANAKVGSEASAMGSIAANAASQQLKTHSPSRVFYDIGQSTGDGMSLGVAGSMPAVGAAVGGGLRGITDAARGVANDNGLMVGFSYVESITTGVEQATKMSQFQQLGFPQIKSAAAKASLGAKGLLGPAGSGAQSYKLESQEVGFGAGTAALPAPPPITVNVALDGQPFHQMTVTAQNAVLAALTDSLSRQRSS